MTIVSTERDVALQGAFSGEGPPEEEGISATTRAANPLAAQPGKKKQQVVTAILVVAPLLGVVAAALGVISPRITLLDVILAVSLYAVSGHGLTAGFHRMLTHRSFKATRWVKITLAVAGSLGMEGSVISWVANHRRHHAYTDKKGDHQSPYEYGDGTWNQIRGALHAHVGWPHSRVPFASIKTQDPSRRRPALYKVRRTRRTRYAA